MKFGHLLLLALLLSARTFAAEAYGTTIKSVTGYAAFGGGDVIFEVNTTVAGCEGGFWLDKDDQGFSSTLSFLLSSYHADAKLSVSGNDQVIWNGGTSNPFCKVSWVTLAR